MGVAAAGQAVKLPIVKPSHSSDPLYDNLSLYDITALSLVLVNDRWCTKFFIHDEVY
jgi:hypothetical protein